MFWNRKAGSAPPQSVTSAAPREPLDLAEEALDTVAAFLRSFGTHAFDVEDMEAEELREVCERWAQHILVGTAEPLRTRLPHPEDDEPEPARRRPRNWGEVRRFVAEHRETEADFVNESFADLREAIWAFIQALSRFVIAERGAEGRVMRQMHRLQTAVERNKANEIKNQALAAVNLVKEIANDRHEHQRRQMERLGARVEAMRGKLHDARQQASLDPLTGLSNRSAFDEHVGRLVDLGVLFGRTACLFMVDVDHFKWVNDNYGHLAGDACLRALGDTLQRLFLRRDDFVARFGGEEFAVVIRDDRPDAVEAAIERLLQAVRDLEIEHQGNPLRITVSVGAARLRPGEDAKSWVERADRALYEAKQAGRDRAVITPNE